jgi:single-strand DNA-binding protein
MSVSVTVAGNLVEDVSRRTTQSGRHLATFRIAHNTGFWDRQTRAWVEREPDFYSVSCWGTLAENVADSLHKGMPVIVSGRLRHYSVDKQVGAETVTFNRMEITAETVGPDLSRGVAQFRRTKSQAVRRAEERAVAEAAAVVGASNESARRRVG